jgi:hypothetical protein
LFALLSHSKHFTELLLYKLLIKLGFSLIVCSFFPLSLKKLPVFS